MTATRKLRELEKGVLAGRKRSLLALTANVSAEAQAAALDAGTSHLNDVEASTDVAGADGFLCASRLDDVGASTDVAGKPLTIQKMAEALRQYSS